MKLDQEARMTIKTLARKGLKNRQIARTLDVDESTVRYHLDRQQREAIDSRSLQPMLADRWREQIDWYLVNRDQEAPLNLAALHHWLIAEHGYTGSLKSVQRFYHRHYPQPRRRARRRFETPPGAQAQVDWDEYSALWVGGREVPAYRFHMKLSYSRKGATVWSPRKDLMSWLHVHNRAFEDLGGIPATVRVDNTKTAVSHGAGPWGELNPGYRRYAHSLRFHIDPCLPRSPEHKGKVERDILDRQLVSDVRDRHWDSFAELQAHATAQDKEIVHRRRCPATGTTVFEAWHLELPLLGELPILPEPFDLVVTRRVGKDCTIGFEGRRYSTPFALLGELVEIRGCVLKVQILHGGQVVAEHPRNTPERIVIDPTHYEGEATSTVLPPTPLGKMGQRLQEISAMVPQQRPLDLYAALAEVAR